MFDASTKLPQGLVHAETYQLGNYDECVDINLKRKKDNVYGKYCLVHLQVIPVEGKYPRFYKYSARDPFSLAYDFNQPALEKFLVSKSRNFFLKTFWLQKLFLGNLTALEFFRGFFAEIFGSRNFFRGNFWL